METAARMCCLPVVQVSDMMLPTCCTGEWHDVAYLLHRWVTWYYLYRWVTWCCLPVAQVSDIMLPTCCTGEWHDVAYLLHRSVTWCYLYRWVTRCCLPVVEVSDMMLPTCCTGEWYAVGHGDGWFTGWPKITSSIHHHNCVTCSKKNLVKFGTIKCEILYYRCHITHLLKKYLLKWQEMVVQRYKMWLVQVMSVCLQSTLMLLALLTSIVLQRQWIRRQNNIPTVTSVYCCLDLSCFSVYF